MYALLARTSSPSLYPDDNITGALRLGPEKLLVRRDKTRGKHNVSKVYEPVRAKVAPNPIALQLVKGLQVTWFGWFVKYPAGHGTQ